MPLAAALSSSGFPFCSSGILLSPASFFIFITIFDRSFFLRFFNLMERKGPPPSCGESFDVCLLLFRVLLCRSSADNERKGKIIYLCLLPFFGVRF
jgi:hypothetical protein